jgi:hypothetical protein
MSFWGWGYISWRSVGQCVLVSGHHLRPSASYYGAPSLTGGWICNLQLLLGVANAIFLGSEFHGTEWPYFTVSVLRLSQLLSPPHSHPCTITTTTTTTNCHPEVEAILPPTVSRPLWLCVWYPPGAHDQILITVICGSLLVGGHSLMREWVLALVSAVTLGSKSYRTPDHILLSHLGLGYIFVASDNFKLSYDQWLVGQSVLISGHHLRIMTYFSFFPKKLSSDICNLLVQVLLGLASAVALGSKSHNTWDHFSFQNWVPLLLPLMT